MSWLLPPETTSDARVLLATRGVRAFVDGLVTVALPYYLAVLGYSDFRIGAITTGTLMGSGALTILLGFRVHTLDRTRLLQAVAIVMMLTGIGFATVTSFWPLMIVAIFGTLNPSSGDVSVFLPTEQALLPSTVSDRFRTALYGRYSLIGFTLAACGSLAAGVPTWVARHKWLSALNADRGVFVGTRFKTDTALLSRARADWVERLNRHAQPGPIEGLRADLKSRPCGCDKSRTCWPRCS